MTTAIVRHRRVSATRYQASGRSCSRSRWLMASFPSKAGSPRSSATEYRYPRPRFCQPRVVAHAPRVWPTTRTQGAPMRWCGALTSILMTARVLHHLRRAGQAELGPFPGFYRRGARQHAAGDPQSSTRRATTATAHRSTRSLTITADGRWTPRLHCLPELLGSAARGAWDIERWSWAKTHGFRNAQASVLAPTGTIGLVDGLRYNGYRTGLSPWSSSRSSPAGVTSRSSTTRRSHSGAAKPARLRVRRSDRRDRGATPRSATGHSRTAVQFINLRVTEGQQGVCRGRTWRRWRTALS